MGFNVSLCELTGNSCQCISHNTKTHCYVPQKNKARKEFIEKSSEIWLRYHNIRVNV